jgi:hypothetical protein
MVSVCGEAEEEDEPFLRQNFILPSRHFVSLSLDECMYVCIWCVSLYVCVCAIQCYSLFPLLDSGSFQIYMRVSVFRISSYLSQ